MMLTVILHTRGGGGGNSTSNQNNGILAPHVKMTKFSDLNNLHNQNHYFDRIHGLYNRQSGLGASLT